jgi:signal recognition particle GTPase
VDVNRLLKQFEAVQAMTKQMSKGRLPAMFGGFGGKGRKGLFGA